MKNLIKVILPAVLMLSASSLWATSQLLTGSTIFDATSKSFHASSGGRLGVSGNPSAQNIDGRTAAAGLNLYISSPLPLVNNQQ